MKYFKFKKRNAWTKIFKQIQIINNHNPYKLIIYLLNNLNKLMRSQYLWLIDKSMMNFKNSKNLSKLSILNFFKIKNKIKFKMKYKKIKYLNKTKF